MSRFTVSETIPRPVAEVWAFATNFDNAPRWMNGVDSLTVQGDAPLTEGTALVFVARGAARNSTVSRSVGWSNEPMVGSYATCRWR